jgi:8-oxo-dGTP pyrophosphatase MutT (NUDIX family)
MIRAAGILIVDDAGQALFLKRSKLGDAAGQWCIPGGKLEGDEEPVDAAIRETLEEVGYRAKTSDLTEWTRRISSGAVTPPAHTAAPDVDFTTFLLKGVKQFVPKLDEEHVAYAWAPYGEPPEPLHPGCRVALAKCSPEWNELKVAQAIAAGDLVSPQFYENLALFDIRITGTGRAFRHEKKDDKGKVVQEEEIVWRDPSLYVNPEFVARCNGLPVILEHPKSEMLDSDEYRDRNVGSVFLPYIKPDPEGRGHDEVWGVAKILDEPAAKLMAENQLSTSPAVVWSDPSVNVEGETSDGRKFLLEGKPSLLDHIAICWQGVWDKGGEPTGVTTVRGDSIMTAEELAKQKAEQEKKSADTLAAVAGLTDTLKGLVTRFDSIEENQKAIRQRFDDDDAKRKDEARRECDSFSFSKRKDDDDDAGFKKRHDAEEGELAEKLEAAGEAKEQAADKAKKRRKDAEEEDDKPAFLKADKRKDAKGSKDDDDDDEDEPEKKADKRKDAKSGKDDDDEDEEHEGKKDDDDDDDDDSHRKDRRKDSRRDSSLDVRALMSRLDAAESELQSVRKAQKALSDEELNAFGKVQSRADAVASCLGQRARGRMMGESLVSYRRHFMNEYKHLSPTWKDKDLTAVIANDAVMGTVEDQILSEALDTAKSPASIKPGEMRMRTHRSDAGHTINEWDGHPRAWMDDLAGTGKQAVKRFITDNRRDS